MTEERLKKKEMIEIKSLEVNKLVNKLKTIISLLEENEGDPNENFILLENLKDEDQILRKKLVKYQKLINENSATKQTTINELNYRLNQTEKVNCINLHKISEIMNILNRIEFQEKRKRIVSSQEAYSQIKKYPLQEDQAIFINKYRQNKISSITSKNKCNRSSNSKTEYHENNPLKILINKSLNITKDLPD